MVNSGNLRSNIPGSLTFIDYATGQASQDAFKTANGRVLGDTPQNAVVYGSKMYIAVYQSNLIEVVDRVSLKSLKTISFGSPPGATATAPSCFRSTARLKSAPIPRKCAWPAIISTWPIPTA